MTIGLLIAILALLKKCSSLKRYFFYSNHHHAVVITMIRSKGTIQIKFLPQRTCVGCGVRRPKTKLLRIVKCKDSTFEIDRKALLPGRGAYVCYSSRCAQLAKKNRSLNRSFRCEVPLLLYEQIVEFIDNLNQENT